jgi:hypothetical protein
MWSVAKAVLWSSRRKGVRTRFLGPQAPGQGLTLMRSVMPLRSRITERNGGARSALYLRQLQRVV